MISREDFWNDPDLATLLLKERTVISDLIETWNSIFQEIEDADTLLSLAHEEGDRQAEQDVERQLQKLASNCRLHP